MNTEAVKSFLSQDQTIQSLKQFINDNINDVMKSATMTIQTAEEIQNFYLSIMLLNNASTQHEILNLVKQHESFHKLLQRLLDVIFQKQQIKQVFQLCLAFLINSSKNQTVRDAILSLLTQKQYLVLCQQLDKESCGPYLLLNLSSGAKSYLTKDIVNWTVQNVQKRDENALLYAQLLKNYFIHLQDDKDKAEIFSDAAKAVCIELTGKEFYEQFVQSLKPTEENQKDIFVKNKAVHTKEVQIELIDILLIYVRFNKVLIKEQYCQLRECHAYNISIYDVCELNDKLNDLIEYAISLEEGEEDQLIPQEMLNQQIPVNNTSTLIQQVDNNIDAVE